MIRAELSRLAKVAAVITLLAVPGLAQPTVAGDTYVQSGTASAQNFGALATILVGPETGATQNKGLLRFEASGLSGVTATDVQKAVLWLYVNRVTVAGSVDVWDVTSSWSESTATWNLQPTAGSNQGTIPVTSAGQWVGLDVTLLVKGWLTVPSTNYGVMLRTTTSNTTSVAFDSKENTTTSHEAQLQIVLFGPPGATGPAGPTAPRAWRVWATGPSGPAGIAGATGPSGPAGIAGATGPSGPAGIAGATGPSGPAGIAGATGPSGPAGIAGATGPSGPAGIAGATGPSGPAGAAGPSGPSGPAGVAGPSGPSGPAGIAGAHRPKRSGGRGGSERPKRSTGRTRQPRLAGRSGCDGSQRPQRAERTPRKLRFDHVVPRSIPDPGSHRWVLAFKQLHYKYDGEQRCAQDARSVQFQGTLYREPGDDLGP